MKVKYFKSCAALAITAVLLPNNLSAASLGSLQIHSSAQQPFAAELLLQPASDENPAELSVRLAPPEKFDEAGLPWQFFFSQLQFHSQRQSDGSLLIQLSSSQPLPEEVVTLLLEIVRPQGNQYLPLKTAVDNQPKHGKKTGFDPGSLSADGRQYGPIKASDTLWSIAKNLARQQGVTTRQMLDKLRQDNPDAFNSGNVDSMKSGAVLQIADAEALARSAAAESRSVKPAEKALELLTPPVNDNDPTPVSPLSPPADKAKLNPPVAGSGEGDYLFLQTRVETLEEQIGMMQQLLVLKDQQLTRLQNSVEDQSPVKLLTLISTLLASISLMLGWQLWRSKPPLQTLAKPSASMPVSVPVSMPTAASVSVLPADADDDFGFNFDPGKNTPPASSGFDSSDAEWTADDELESKIDLAKAYLDMDDLEMARTICEQVLLDGNPLQQALAQTLLDEIKSRHP